MRELWARRIAFFTLLLALLLAAVFANMQNPPGVPVTAVDRKSTVATEVGRQIYNEQGCARCHSIAGKGNPRSPLDGVGARYTGNELADWITGMNAQLPSHIISLKQSYRQLPASDLEALVAYLKGLR